MVQLGRVAWTGILLTTVVCLVAASMAAQTTAWQWLERMGEAMQSLDYTGTFIYVRGEEMETMQVIHRTSADGEQERLIALTGEAREVIRGRDVLTCVWPGSRVAYIEPRRQRTALPVRLPVDGAELAPYYHSGLGPRSRIAGRFCQLVELVPQDAYRYGYRLCIDNETQLLLLSEMRSQDNELIEKVQFTSLHLPERIADSALESVLIQEDFTVVRVDSADSPDLLPDPRWRIGKLPPGFGLHHNSKRMMPGSEEPVQHMIVSDGLASVSVFIANDAADWMQHEHRGTTHAGPVNAYRSAVAGHSVVALGEVPTLTVEMIGRAIQFDETVVDGQ